LLMALGRGGSSNGRGHLSLFRIVLFRRHTPQLCEHHLAQGRLDRRKLSHRGGGKRRYLSHILAPFALRTSGDLFVCAKDLLVESIGTWATQASSGFHRCTYPHAGHRRGRATGGKVSKMTISVVRPVGTGRFVCGHLITTSLTANPSTGIRRRSEPKILMRRRGAAAKWSGSCLSKDRRTRYQIRKANPAARPW